MFEYYFKFLSPTTNNIWKTNFWLSNPNINDTKNNDPKLLKWYLCEKKSILIQTKGIKGFNVRPETLKALEKNMGEIFHNIGKCLSG